MNEAKVTTLREAIDTIDTIHLANIIYWREGKEQSREAKGEYSRRLDRLREIRTDLAKLGL